MQCWEKESLVCFPFCQSCSLPNWKNRVSDHSMVSASNADPFQKMLDFWFIGLQDIATSGLSFAIVRTGGTDVAEPGFEEANSVALGPQGSLPPQSRISKTQASTRPDAQHRLTFCRWPSFAVLPSHAVFCLCCCFTTQTYTRDCICIDTVCVCVCLFTYTPPILIPVSQCVSTQDRAVLPTASLGSPLQLLLRRKRPCFLRRDSLSVLMQAQHDHCV